MRESNVFGLFVLFCLLGLAALALHSASAVSGFNAGVPDLDDITSSLKLTDISFSNDARYTRSPSQADIFSAFQDHPGSIEHFPSGSVIAPPGFGAAGGGIGVR